MSTRILCSPRITGGRLRDPNWFADQQQCSTVHAVPPSPSSPSKSVVVAAAAAHGTFTNSLHALQQGHRSNTSSGSRRDMLTNEVNAPALCSGTRSANRGASWEKQLQIWHLGSGQLRASALTPRLLCTGYAATSLFTRKVISH